jgi:hypothetical protein
MLQMSRVVCAFLGCDWVYRNHLGFLLLLALTPAKSPITDFTTAYSSIYLFKSTT